MVAQSPSANLRNLLPVSGFLSGPNPTRQRSFYIGFLVAFIVWSVTPACWLTVLWRLYRKGTIFSSPSRGVFAKFWYYYSLAEIPFSIYFQYLTWQAAKRRPPPQVSFDTLHHLLTKSLTVGLPPKEDGPTLRSGKVASSLTEAASNPENVGLKAMQSKRIDASDAKERRERLRAWFFFAQLEDIYADNIREWLAWAFTARNLDEVKNDPKMAPLIEEGLEMVKLRLNWPHVRSGYNPKVRAIRLTLDPIRTLSRPLGYYVVTNAVTKATITWLRTARGFSRERVGRCYFLVKRPDPRSPAKSNPILFLHGLGIGLGQYIPMLTTLALHKDGVVIPLQPHISTNIFSPTFLDPPGKDEQAHATIKLLQRHGMERVTTLSHSNGTMVLGWMLRTAPEMCVRNILVDPVSFCLWEGSVCYSFIYRQWATMVEVLLGYFVGRELGIAHTIGRRFIWYDMILWADEFPSTDPKNLHILFGERDLLVDVPGSVGYLQGEGIQDECITVLPNYQHGQALMHNGTGMRIALKEAGVRTQ